MCDTGLATGETDMHGHELFSGDIVQLWHGNWIGEEFEEWLPSSGLTAILGNQYQSYSNGITELLTDKPELFTMGIAGIGVQGGEWKVSLVKSHSEIIAGERFAAYGINYR
tara:strand:+ start:11611 stop:11943 length:333 start_codon:yes stop_codon:yes gene_type:complete